MTKKIIKSAQDIKTLTGRANEGSFPYKAYMKLSILEMEKYRRGKEKQSALDRVRKIDQRFQDIELSRQEIFSALENKGIKNHRFPGIGDSPEVMKTNTGPFKIRY